MQIIRGSLRRIVFLALPGVTFASRGFPAGLQAAAQRRESGPEAVSCGFRLRARPSPGRGGTTGATAR
jgi:hypothetical protein